ncbi:HNH endonuclease [Mesoflavibacter profundi]|uniref:HNH endonuclease n=1 Tax=Mesoflavibacter profundi TaxID=2708110 RepID=UPI003517B48F
MIYNFHKGKTANKIIEITKSEIQRTSQYFFEPIKNIEYSKIINKDKRFFYTKGDDTYLMFAYKRSYRTIHYNDLPRYHVCQCKTRDEYSGFTYASSMPVEVYCRDQKQTLEELQQLKICSNCVSASQKGFYSFLAKGKPWYEYVLEYANSDNEIANKTQDNGYVVMWKQISEAIRERIGFKCECCQIILKDEPYYLEVHHKDYQKTNNSIENLKALCVLCHATVDERHLKNFKKESLKVEAFIDLYREYIENNNQSRLLRWELE